MSKLRTASERMLTIDCKRGLLWRRLILGLALGISTGLPATSSHRFDSATVPPSPFMINNAKARGLPEPVGQPGVELHGELMLHQGEGPFPVVILFPNCRGWSAVDTDWPQVLNSWGYAALSVASIDSRPMSKATCSRSKHGAVGSTDVVFDAIGAIKYVRGLDHIDASRIALMGWGFGATGVLKSASAGGFSPLFKERANAVIAFYPSCEVDFNFHTPVLVLIGREDKVYHSVLCETMQRELLDGSAAFDLEVYPELGHDFDLNEVLTTELKSVIQGRINVYLQHHFDGA